MNRFIKHRRNATLLLICVCCCTFACAQGLPPCDQGLRPTDELPLSTVQGEREHRIAVSGQFDDRSNIAPKLDEPMPAGHGFGSISDRARIDPIPAADSDVIVVGQVQKYQSFFSNDHTLIYTEFSVLSEKTQKGDPLLAAYTVTEVGGAIRKSNGQIVAYHSNDPELLFPGKRYVLFLKHNPANEMYFTIKKWELLNGHPYALDREDLQDVRNGRSTIVTLSETDFIAAIQDAVDRN